MSLREKLVSGEFVILAEMDPPKGVDVSSMVANAARVKGKVDAFVVPEMSNAVIKMSSLGGCMLLQSKGLETIMQTCCRDRNRLALQADLLAAHALGVSNVMATLGEDPTFGDHHRARAVHDVDLLELLETIQKLQTGRDMAGIELKGAPRLCVGFTVNAGASGGTMSQLDKTFPTNDCSMCIISPKLVECGSHPNIELLTLADLQNIEGEVGNFKATILQHPRQRDRGARIVSQGAA